MIQFDLTPDPRVLIALTHTPLQPLDALCELIDNAIDSFHTAKVLGDPVEFPLVVVDLPGRAELERGEGFVRVRDNGPGLTTENARNALRAGFSGNNSYDTLGLFGMGFNVATGKIGRVTRFTTARPEDDEALEVVIDLLHMQEQGGYGVPGHRVPKHPSTAAARLSKSMAGGPKETPIAASSANSRAHKAHNSKGARTPLRHSPA